MSTAGDDPRLEMTKRVAEAEALIREIERYLKYLEALRTATRPPGGRNGGGSEE